MGHGFFIKFFKGNEDFYCLMTNDHVITEDMLNQKKIFVFIMIWILNQLNLKK